MSIKITNFTKTFGEHIAVKNFSMECRKGYITGILGPNGAGKTTILKAICARHFATKGKVLVEGTDCTVSPQKIRNITGFVTETTDFPEEYYVKDFLAMTMELHSQLNCNDSNSIEFIKNLVGQLSLKEILDKKIKHLSKGQKERVNFAQALIYDPTVLVLDEPASGLDPNQIQKMRKTVQSLKENRTIVLSTHLMQEVEALCDYVYIINKGECVADGTISDILENTGSKTLDEAFLFLTSGERNV